MLPQAFAQEVAQYFEQHFAEDAIVCIRKLSFNLRLLVSDLNTGVLAQHLAKCLAQTMFAEHKGGQSNTIKVFSEQAHYSASFIIHLIAPKAEQEWCYQDFHHYRYLSTQEAMVTLLSDRAAILLPIMQHLQAVQMLDVSLNKIDENHAAWLITCWFDKAEGSKASRFSLEDVERAISLSATWPSAIVLFSETRDTPSAKAYLNAYCHLLASINSVSSADTLANKSQLATFILFSVLQYAEPILDALDGKAKDIDMTKVNAANGLIRRALKSVVEHAQNKVSLAHDIRRVIDSSKGSSAAFEDTSQKKDKTKNNYASSQVPRKRNDGDSVCWSEMSEYAGLGLLLPCIISLQLWRHYSVQDIYKALQFLLRDLPRDLQRDRLSHPLRDTPSDSPSDLPSDLPSDSPSDATQKEHGAINEAWLERVFTSKINKDSLQFESAYSELDGSGLKQSLLLGLAPQIKQKLNALHGHEQLAALIMAQFAARLSGLQMSSHAYLFTQFLHVRGSIQMTQTALTIKLSPIALGVVLKMTGYSPYRGRLDWLDCDVIIEVQA